MNKVNKVADDPDIAEDVIRMRTVLGKSLSEIGVKYGKSREWARLFLLLHLPDAGSSAAKEVKKNKTEEQKKKTREAVKLMLTAKKGHFEERRRQAWEMRKEKFSLNQIREKLGYTHITGVIRDISRHSKSLGVEVPRNAPGTSPDRAEMGYSMARDGHDWSQVANKLGYKSQASAMTSIKGYAIRRGLPWPIRSEK